MKTMSTIGWIIFFLGTFLFSRGWSRVSGTFEYNSSIPNKSIAVIFIAMGLSVMFISFFVKPQKDK
ncbi:hypothetical protein AMS59_21910 [Lysinibacillus sp. FJAT-14745]|uniref:hypothetical protein n=1 Tax=Lysinibacillus sp. FJAT-14745 TaxID=1704289 RepID=UPI0006ABD226|nr:hypothetical protein [Lysinibacillus sp. FJAT-14745]KOP69956.1 hypothetical protein AMS59_21910 [Lysinibacillus sp. FJAT-14745]